MTPMSKPGELRTVIAADQIQKRVKEMGRQISDDYKGKSIHALAMLENGFMFMADLVRALDVPVTCQFIKPRYRKQQESAPDETLEIFFQPRRRYSRQACACRGGPCALRRDQRFPDERLARPRRGFGQIGNAARPAIGSPGAVAAGLFRLSRRRSLSHWLRPGFARADEPESAPCSRHKLNVIHDLSHVTKFVLFPSRRGRIKYYFLPGRRMCRNASTRHLS